MVKSKLFKLEKWQRDWQGYTSHWLDLLSLKSIGIVLSLNGLIHVCRKYELSRLKLFQLMYHNKWRTDKRIKLWFIHLQWQGHNYTFGNYIDHMIFPLIKPFHKFSNMTQVTETLFTAVSRSFASDVIRRSMTSRKARCFRAIFARNFLKIPPFLWNIDIFRNYHVIKRIWNELSFHTIFMKLMCFISPSLWPGDIKHTTRFIKNTLWNENSFQILYVTCHNILKKATKLCFTYNVNEILPYPWMDVIYNSLGGCLTIEYIRIGDCICRQPCRVGCLDCYIICVGSMEGRLTILNDRKISALQKVHICWSKCKDVLQYEPRNTN